MIKNLSIKIVLIFFITFYLDEPKPEESEDTDAVHRRFLKEPSAKVKDGVSNSEQLAKIHATLNFL